MKNTRGEESYFEDLIDRFVLTAIDRAITSFDQMLLSLPGVYPTIALKSLERLVSRGKIAGKILADAIELTSGGLCKKPNWGYASCKPEERTSLPVPHPLGYDWRFGDKATGYLLERCLELTSPADTVVLLGAPSVLVKAIKRGYPRRIILFEEDRLVTDFLADVAPKGSVVRCDLTEEEVPELSAKAIICDSPWYADYVTCFLWSACRICKIEGYLLLSTPAIGTRPNVDQEWAKTLEWTNRLGLTLKNLEFGVLPYISPPFERNALRAEGLHNIPQEWRCSNLAVFLREHEVEAPRPPKCSVDSKWAEEVVDGVRIRFRQGKDLHGFEDPILRTVVPGDILPSVSRWDERRKLADIWTSGNRIFGCQGAGLLQVIVKAIAAHQSTRGAVVERLGRRLSQVETNSVLMASDQIINIILAERNEYVL